MPPRIAKLKTEESAGAESGSATQWRSRFPVARIKKIMQADEDVGKVAQVVPVIISKAVELFMASMVQEASRHALETGHKRVLPGHLKLAVQKSPMFDFLEPNVAKIADPVQVAPRQADGERKSRKSRAKRPTHDSTEDEEEEQDGHGRANAHVDVKKEQVRQSSDDERMHKKVKSEDESQQQQHSASRSMSIANMMS